VNLVIGQGVPQTGNFASIAWADGDKYLETAIDLDGGGYTLLGVTQFLSVPYAIFSQKAAAVKDGANPGEMLYWDGEAWMAIPPGEHNQTLRLCTGVPTWGACTHNLILITNPADAGTVTGEGQYKAGEQVNITAEANTGWEFVNWTDDDGIVSEAASFVYTMPAEDITLTANFSSQSLNIGDFYQGGIIAYILQPGDPGYIEGEVHGLIAAPTDQSTGAQWGCYGTLIGGTSTALGTGAANTAAIVAGCSTAVIAARICDNLELNGYSDWYLPSKDELNKLYINRTAIGGFASGYYWSSSESSSIIAWGQYFNSGFQIDGIKDFTGSVRAVRAF
jgi:uncharacterized repeat protein (TIGR02543 family)